MARDKPGKRKTVQRPTVATEKPVESNHRASISQREQQDSLERASETMQNARPSLQLSAPLSLQMQPDTNSPDSNPTLSYVQPCSVPSRKQLKQNRSQNAEKFDFPLFLYDIENWQIENGIGASLKPGQTLEEVPGATKNNPIRPLDVNEIWSLPNGVWVQYTFTDEDGQPLADADNPFPLFLPPCSIASRVPGTHRWVWKKRTADDPPSTWTWEEYREYLDLWGMPGCLFYAHRNGRKDPSKERYRAVQYPEPDPRGPYYLHSSQWQFLEDELASLDPTKQSVMVKNAPYQIQSKPRPVDPSECRIVKKDSWREWPWRSVTHKRVARSSEEAISNGQRQDLAIEACLSGRISQFHVPNKPVYHTRLEIANKNQKYARRLARDPTVVVNPSTTDFEYRGREGRFEYLLPLDAWFAQIKFASQNGSSIIAEQLFSMMQTNEEYVLKVQESGIQIVWIPAGASVDATHRINIDLSHELQQEEVMRYPGNPDSVSTESSDEESINGQGEGLGIDQVDLADEALDEDATSEQTTHKDDENITMDQVDDEDYVLSNHHGPTAQKSTAKGERDHHREPVSVGVEEPEKFQVCGIYFPHMNGFDWYNKEHIARLNRWRQQTYRRKQGRRVGPKTHFTKAELHYLERFYQHFGKGFYAKDLAENFNKHLNGGVAKRTVYSIEERLKRLVRDNMGKEDRSNIRVNPVSTKDNHNHAYEKTLRAWEKEWKTTVEKDCTKISRTEEKMNPGRKRTRGAENDDAQASTPGEISPVSKKTRGAMSTRADAKKIANDTSTTATGYNSAATGGRFGKDSSDVTSAHRAPPLPSDYYGGDGVTPRWIYIKSPRDAQGRVIAMLRNTTETAMNGETSRDQATAKKNHDGADLPDYESPKEDNAADHEDDLSSNNTDGKSDDDHPNSEGEPEINDSCDP